jgi:dTMP kinase
MARGRLITIEGLDGAGKTTLAGGLEELLAEHDIDARAMREPGGVDLAERIRALVKDPELNVAPRTEALLYAAARAQLVDERVKPLLAEGTWVVLDRFVHSSLAYQGEGRGLGEEAVKAINEFGTGGLEPDLTLLLHVDPAVGRARLATRGDPLDRLELEAPDFFDRVHSFYERLEADPRVHVIDSDQSPSDVLAEAWKAVAQLR